MKIKILKIIARIGYAARGFTYLIIGFYALLAAFNLKSIVGTKGAIKGLQSLPFGSVLVTILAGGFLLYSTWRLAQSIIDADNRGHSFKALIVRIALFGSSLSHIFLSYWCLTTLVLKLDRGSSSNVSSFFDNDSLKYGLIIISFIFAIICVAQVYKGISKGYSKRMKSISLHVFLDKLCQFGLILRGVSFGIFSYYLFRVGIEIFDADQSKSKMKASLKFIEQQPFGEYLLGVMGLGLIAFAIYSFIVATYREVEIDDI